MPILASTLPVVVSSPPDIQTILTNLGLLALAVAAVVGGIYKGIKEVKLGGADTGKSVASAVIVETVTLSKLTESNIALTTQVKRLIDLLEKIERHMDIEQHMRK